MSSSDDLSAQMERAARQVEENRRRMLEEAQQSRSIVDRLMENTRRAVDAAAAGTAAAAAAAAGAVAFGSQQFNRYGPWGSGTAGDIARGPRAAALEAISGSANVSLFRRSSGAGNYFAEPMGVGELLFHAGAGAAMSAATGGLIGSGAAVRFGYDPRLVQSRASSELDLRIQNIGNATLSALPFLGSRMFAFRGMEEDTQRLVAQRLSFIRSGGMRGAEVGGVGFKSNSSFIESISKGMGDELRRINSLRGFDLSDEEAGDIQTAALDTFSPAEIERLVRRGGAGGFKDKVTRAMRNINTLKADLNAEVRDIAEVRRALRGVIESSDIERFLGTAGGRGRGGLNDMDVVRLEQQQIREGVAIGLRSSAAVAYGRRQTSTAESLFASMSRGEIDPTTASMYGGSGGFDSAAALAARMRSIGLNFGNSDAGVRSLFYSDPGAASRMSGGYVDILSRQALSVAANPFAATNALYDPDTQARMATGGAFAAFERARSSARFRSSVFGGRLGSEAFKAYGVTEFQRLAGIGDNAEAQRLYSLFADRETYFSSALGTGQGQRASGLMEALSAISPDVSRDAVADLIRSGRIGPGDDISKMSPARVAALLAGTDGLAGTGAAIGEAVRAYVADRQSNPGERPAGRDYAPAGGDGRTRTTDLQANIRALMSAGFSATDINQALRARGAGSQFSVGPDGSLRVWSSEGQSDGRQRFTDAFSVSWADEFIGDDAWQRDSYSGLLKALSDLGGSAASQQSWANMRERMFDATGAAGSAFLEGTSGQSVNDRIQSLLSTDPSKLGNKYQRDFRERFGKGLSGKALMSLGVDDARDLLTSFYKSRSGGASSEMISRISRAATEQDFSALADDVTRAGGGDDVATMAALTFISRNRSGLSALQQNRGATEGTPIWVRLAGATGNGLGAN